MIDALIVSNVLLWIAVVVLAGVVWALLRQIGLLHERVAPAGALVPRGGPVVGTTAPVIEVTNWHDQSLRLGGTDPDGPRARAFEAAVAGGAKTVAGVDGPDPEVRAGQAGHVGVGAGQ